MSLCVCVHLFLDVLQDPTPWVVYILTRNYTCVYIFIYICIHTYIYMCQMHMLTRNCMCLTSDDGSRTGISSPIPWINWHAIISINLISVEKNPNGEPHHQRQEKGIDWFVEEMRPQDAEALHRLGEKLWGQ